MISKHNLRLLPIAFLNLALLGCTPAISDLDLSQAAADHLPRDAALRFLMAMDNNRNYLPCRFRPDEVEREHSGGKRAAYSSLTVEPAARGSGLLRENGRIFCFFGGPEEADRQHLEQRLFFRKTVTALLALGVQAPSNAK
ncbi:hypothetical protein [uncultured Thiodictyon sp.]|uniref:hypothetical protein n=1 Tax=uncultured Thiodictyon sp. TaxID=1846217 RepID=UPI0025FEF52A|nr:hypothetical protein [uncultured Thiodictyon sp.]